VTDDWRDVLADAGLVEVVEGDRASSGPTWREIGPVAVRAAQQARVASRPAGPAVASVTDLRIADRMDGRLYRPTAEGAAALTVFLHGGMWTIGSLDSHDRLCRRMARATGSAVLAVDYRRAPEHPAPAAVDDAAAAVLWAAARRAELAGDGSCPLLVAGDSSGGNLAALACLRLRDQKAALPHAQVLIYPNTDLTLSQPSVTEKAAGWGISIDDITWGIEFWVPDAARRGDPVVSPLFEPDLAGLPTALIVTAEHDPLRDEGEAYAAALEAAGTPVLLRREPAMIHGFLTLDTLSPAAAAAGERVFDDMSRLIKPYQLEKSWVSQTVPELSR
jgi:acetyl esterase